MSKGLHAELRSRFKDFLVAHLSTLEEVAKQLSEFPRKEVPVVTFHENGWQMYIMHEPDPSPLIHFSGTDSDKVRALAEYKNLTTFAYTLEVIRATFDARKVEPAQYEKYFGDNILFKFVTEYLRRAKRLAFDDRLFNSVYQELEDYLIRSNERFKTFALLDGLEGDFDVINMGQARIKRLSESERVLLFIRFDFERGSSWDETFLNFPYLVETETFVPKGTSLDSREAVNVIDNTITALRLFKEGLIRRRRTLTFGVTPWDGIWDGVGVLESPSGPKGISPEPGKYTLTKPETSELLSFWSGTQPTLEQKPHPLDIGLERFNDAYNRRKQEDKLIDLMVAFEALLYRGGEAGEFRYKLALRTALLVEDSVDKRKPIFKRMKEIYDSRSAIVHGEPIPADLPQISRDAEDYLRQSLNKIVRAMAKGKSHEAIIEDIDGLALSGPRIGL